MILGGLTVGMLILEIGLRVGGISYPSLYTADEYSGWALRPGVGYLSSREGGAYVQTNSDGLRDREHTKTKPANTLRIVILGDSYALAEQVAVENTFWSVMEQELEGCKTLAGRSVEAINFGAAGYGTAQELTTLRHRAWDYDPDIVLLAFFVGNDIQDNSIEFSGHPMRPYFTYQNGELVLDASFLKSNDYQIRQTWYSQLLYRVINSSRVLQLLNEVKNVIWQRTMASQTRDLISDEAIVKPTRAIYFEPNDSSWEDAWRVTEGLIVLMRDEVEERGAYFLVVTISTPIQAHPDRLIREAFMESLAINDLFYPDARIRALGERENFAVLNLGQPFLAFAEEHQIFLHGFENATLGEGHWNEEGHRLAGQMITQQLCEQLLDER